jgi:hypothetical protein
MSLLDVITIAGPSLSEKKNSLDNSFQSKPLPSKRFQNNPSQDKFSLIIVPSFHNILSLPQSIPLDQSLALVRNIFQPSPICEPSLLNRLPPPPNIAHTPVNVDPIRSSPTVAFKYFSQPNPNNSSTSPSPRRHCFASRVCFNTISREPLLAILYQKGVAY